MKIIATTTTGYICEVPRREVSLLGVASPSIGDDVDLARAFDTLDSLRAISRTNLKNLGYEISKLQKKYDEISEAYEKSMIFDTIKTSSKTDEKVV